MPTPCHQITAQSHHDKRSSVPISTSHGLYKQPTQTFNDRCGGARRGLPVNINPVNINTVAQPAVPAVHDFNIGYLASDELLNSANGALETTARHSRKVTDTTQL